MKWCVIYSVISAFWLALPALAANEVQSSWLAADVSVTRQLAQQAIKSADLPGEKTTLMYHLNVQLDGDVVTKNVKWVQFYPTYNDTHSDGTKNIYWDQEVEQLTILEAGVVTAAGDYQRLNTENVRVVDSDSYNTFTDTKQVMLPFSGLGDNSISVLEYQVRLRRSELESPWSTSVYPVLFEDVKDFAVNVYTDERVKIDWSSTQRQVYCKSVGAGMQCRAQNLPAYTDDTDVVWRDEVGQVVIAEAQSWSDVIEHTEHAFEKADFRSPAVTAMAAELLDDSSGVEQSISAIHKFVARDIRYISMAELGHRITPHTFESIVSNRFGDCKDKSALLVGLLREAGFNPYPVLVATQRSDPSKLRVPSGQYFDHMVVCFKHGKQFICLDATDPNTHWQTTSSWIQGRVALPLLKGARPYRMRSSRYRWRLNVKTDMVFDAGARLREKQERDYLGEYAGGYRRSLSGKNEQELQQWATDQYQNKVSDSVKPTFKFAGLGSMGDSLNIISDTEYEPFLNAESDLNYIEQDSWVRAELSETKIGTRHYDAYISGIDIRSEVSFDLGGLWRLTREPPRLNLKGRFGSLRRSVKVEDSILKLTTVARIPRQQVFQKDIDKFNDFIDLLVRESNINMLGEKL